MITVLALSPCIDKIYYIDNFAAGKLFRAKDWIKSAGGKGVNVARVCRLLGEEVNCIGFKAGHAGEWIEKQLSDIGVNAFFVEVDGETRTNNNVIDLINNTETEILEKGPFIPEHKICEFMDIFKGLLQNTSVLVCSGGLPEGADKCIYAHLIDCAKQHNIITVLDTSGEILKRSLEASPYLFKPNIRELKELSGKSIEYSESLDEVVNTAKYYVEKNKSKVLVSMGKKGAVFVSEKHAIKANIPDVNVLNTIGSGDSTVAGCAVSLRRGFDEPLMLKFAMACGVNNSTFMEIGKVVPQEVDRLIDMIDLEYLYKFV